MAAIAKQSFLLLLLLTLLFSLQIHARESQFFNKVPSNNGEKETPVVVPNNEESLKNKEQVQEPNFVPESENGGYGLYGHETGQFPPTTTTTTTTNEETYKNPTNLPYNGEQRESYPKYLPKNYNTDSYVTEPEGYRGQFENNQNPEGYRGEFDNNKNPNFYNSDNSYYSNKQQGLGETKLAGESYSTNAGGNYFYGNNYNHENTYHNGEQQGMSDTRLYSNNNNNNYYNGEPQGLSDTRLYSNNVYNHNTGNLNGGQKQGMSDTRYLENGKYFFDVGMDKNFNRGAYESTKTTGFYGNPENSNEFNNYQNQEQFQNFQDEEDLP